MDAVFHALSHTTRRQMLGRLADRERTVGELAAPFAMSLAAASKHIKVLEGAALVERTVDGRRHVCRLAPHPLAEASAWLRFYERFWTEQREELMTCPGTGPERARSGLPPAASCSTARSS
jgi:DNA-binding transcriptional ArsR family regulator